jgi:hypothetical protein
VETASETESATTAGTTKNKIRHQGRRFQRPPAPSLRFSPYAWAKLLFLRDVGQTEVGGFGVSWADDLLFVENVELVRQTCSWSSVEFDDAAVADYFDRMADDGMMPQWCGRLWIHTHPGNCALPSTTDEATFARVFGRNNWAVMFILAQGGEVYARLQFSAGPGGAIELPVQVDYAQPFPATKHGQWLAEYRACVVPDQPSAASRSGSADDQRWWEDQDWFTDSEFRQTDRHHAEGAESAEEHEHDSWLAEWEEYQSASNGESF